MRALVLTLALGVAGAALLPSHQANAWWDRFHRWHPDYHGPRVFVPRPVYAPPIYGRPLPYYGPRPYAHWVPPHYNRFGRFVPGHWG